MVDDAGTYVGHVDCVEVDPMTGAVDSIEVTRTNASGLGGETTTVDMGTVESIGDEFMTMRRR